MALVPQASGSEALGFWARRLASSTKRLVRRRSPRSASANSLTAQLVVSERLMPDSLGNGLILGCYEVLRPQHTPRASKTKNVGNWQPCDRGYVIVWVVNINGTPIKFDGLIGDAILREANGAT